MNNHWLVLTLERNSQSSIIDFHLPSDMEGYSYGVFIDTTQRETYLGLRSEVMEEAIRISAYKQPTNYTNTAANRQTKQADRPSKQALYIATSPLL